MKLPVVILLWLQAATQPSPLPQAKYEYLTQATNRIIAQTNPHLSPEPKMLAQVSADACKTLARLLEDKEFYQDIERAAKLSAAQRNARTKLKRDLWLFLDSFMRLEEAALRRAGLSEEAVQHLLWSAALFRDSLDADKDAATTIATIRALQRDVCESATTIDKSQDRQASLETFKKWAFRFGGVTLVVVDMGATVAPPVAAGSAAIGITIVGWGEAPGKGADGPARDLSGSEKARPR